MIFSLIPLTLALHRFLINTAPKRPAPKRPAPKCRRAETAAPKRRRQNGDAQTAAPRSHVPVMHCLSRSWVNTNYHSLGTLYIGSVRIVQKEVGGLKFFFRWGVERRGGGGEIFFRHGVEKEGGGRLLSSII